MISIVNNSSETIPAFGCCRITGFDPSGSQGGLLTVEKPNVTGAQYSHVLNGRQPIKPGKVGKAFDLNGPAFGLYDSDSAVLPSVIGQSWGPVADSWELAANVGGFESIGETEIDSVLACIRSPMLAALGKADADIDIEDTGTVSVWYGEPGGEVDTTYNLTGVINRFGPIQSGDFVRLAWTYQDGWEIAGFAAAVLLGKADANIASGASGMISIWSGTKGSESDTTVNKSAYWRGAGTIQLGDWVGITFVDTGWEISPIDCPQ